MCSDTFQVHVTILKDWIMKDSYKKIPYKPVHYLLFDIFRHDSYPQGVSIADLWGLDLEPV